MDKILQMVFLKYQKKYFANTFSKCFLENNSVSWSLSRKFLPRDGRSNSRWSVAVYLSVRLMYCIQTAKDSIEHILCLVTPDCLFGLYWTGLILFNGFQFLVISLSYFCNFLVVR